MEKLREKHFQRIMEENSEKEREKQWKRSKIVFERFYEYLKNTRGLKEKTAARRTDLVAFFVMNYLFIYEDVESMLEVWEDIIRRFLGNWYIRKFLDPNISTIKSFLRAISDFFTFLYKEGFIFKEELDEIKKVCKDIAWFEMRLRTYFKAQGKEFYKWLKEYDYGSIL